MKRTSKCVAMATWPSREVVAGKAEIVGWKFECGATDVLSAESCLGYRRDPNMSACDHAECAFLSNGLCVNGKLAKAARRTLERRVAELGGRHA